MSLLRKNSLDYLILMNMVGYVTPILSLHDYKQKGLHANNCFLTITIKISNIMNF